MGSGRVFKVLMYGNKQHRLSEGDEQLLLLIGHFGALLPR